MCRAVWEVCHVAPVEPPVLEGAVNGVGSDVLEGVSRSGHAEIPFAGVAVAFFVRLDGVGGGPGSEVSEGLADQVRGEQG